MLNARQIGELESRAFLGDEAWKSMKQDYDQCMAYRKSIKGKPDEAQLAMIKVNAAFIEFYGSVLFHSVKLQKQGLCGCTVCGQKRVNRSVV